LIATEDQLCAAFAEQVKENSAFAIWLLQRTKFASFSEGTRLLHEEQLAIRPRKQWWRHWWCHVPELEKDRETDIFMVFEKLSDRRRFALHIENKRDNYKFNEGQAAAYTPRAKHMSNKVEYLDYSDFATILLAPRSFRERFASDSALFEVFIAYEEVARFVPAFSV
jgi:hypothetical protein